MRKGVLVIGGQEKVQTNTGRTRLVRVGNLGWARNSFRNGRTYGLWVLLLD